MHAQGKAVGLLNDRPADPSEADHAPADDPAPRAAAAPEAPHQAPRLPFSRTHERRPTQDELMGYHDDEPDLDDEPF